jgi:hypothetical protein
MGEAIKDLGITLVFVGLATAGGRKIDAYLRGIYGGSYAAAGFLTWRAPTCAKLNNWLTWVGNLFDKANSFFG